MKRHGPSCGCAATRRGFLAVAAGAAFVGGTALAASAERGLIDVHHHVVPPFWFDEVKDHIAAQGGGRIVPNWYGWSPEKSLAEMDQAGVETAMLSVSAPGVWFGDDAKGRSLTRRCNEYIADLVQKHPGRFGMLAAVPLPDREGSLAEIAYAFDVLKADGVGLFTSYGDRYPGDAAFAAVFDALNARRAVVYFHPTAPGCCTAIKDDAPPFLVEFTQDTNRAILSLMYSGSLPRLRDTRFIFSHAGGTIPMLAGRIAELAPSVPALVAKTPNGVEYELRRLHYEVANSANRPAIAALTSLVPDTQTLFGSDFPLVPLGVTAGGLSRVGLTRPQLDALGHGNARRLFPRLSRGR